MTILLSDIIRDHPISRYNNCSLPNGSIVKKIDYKLQIPELYGNTEDLEKRCTHKYFIYKKNSTYTLYKRKNKNEYIICFEDDYMKRYMIQHPMQCIIM
jgi:hypothetical protein